MKKLNLEEMENVQGGIACGDIVGVIDYLYVSGNIEQGNIVLMLYLSNGIQCVAQ